MTKAELIERVAKKTKASKAMAGNVIDATFGEITTLLGKGDSISLTGFGSFSTSKRAKRKGRNPQTGAEITIPASKVARFKAGKGLKDTVGGKKK